jgi:hypothetical protein
VSPPDVRRRCRYVQTRHDKTQVLRVMPRITPSFERRARPRSEPYVIGYSRFPRCRELKTAVSSSVSLNLLGRIPEPIPGMPACRRVSPRALSSLRVVFCARRNRGEGSLSAFSQNEARARAEWRPRALRGTCMARSVGQARQGLIGERAEAPRRWIYPNTGIDRCANPEGRHLAPKAIVLRQ